MDLRTQRDVSIGFGDGLAQAFEMVLTPAIFGGIGFLIDRWLGTGPFFMLALGTLVFLYECWRVAYAYIQTMEQHDADKPWARTQASVRTEQASVRTEQASVRTEQGGHDG